MSDSFGDQLGLVICSFAQAFFVQRDGDDDLPVSWRESRQFQMADKQAGQNIADAGDTAKFQADDEFGDCFIVILGGGVDSGDFRRGRQARRNALDYYFSFAPGA